MNDNNWDNNKLNWPSHNFQSGANQSETPSNSSGGDMPDHSIPPSNQQPGSLEIGKIISDSFNLIVKNPLIFIPPAIYVVGLVISYVLDMIIVKIRYEVSKDLFSSFAFNNYLDFINLGRDNIVTGLWNLLSLPYLIVLSVSIAIIGYKGGQINFGTVFKDSWKYYPKALILNFIYTFLTGSGLCCCLLPGVLIGIILIFWPVVLIEESQEDFFSPFSLSYKLVKSNFWSIFLLVLIYFIFNIIGFSIILIGEVFTWSLSAAALVITYNKIRPFPSK